MNSSLRRFNSMVYQNIAEAEYIVSVYMYMRMMAKCAAHPNFGFPKRVTTVDCYQQQQNDYILLSLVRTRNVGHIRDIRRLIVGISREHIGIIRILRTTSL
eukprot:TRINITY_DN1034_c0_g1_i3.p1 TRINITY_DN1034_c0_g1~~TRINITY_DN1034_c0_g1_i3.p1  ORF type:complete len:101 (+),score=4.01 TRINITY_DN1034_c0_g1_i3:591-893(+)